MCLEKLPPWEAAVEKQAKRRCNLILQHVKEREKSGGQLLGDVFFSVSLLDITLEIYLFIL